MGIAYPARGEDLFERGAKGGLLEGVEVAGVVEVGTYQVVVVFFDEVMGELAGGFAIIGAKGEEVELEEAADVFQFVKECALLVEIAISFGVGDHGLVALHLQFKENALQVLRGVGHGKFHEYQVVVQGEKGFIPFQEFAHVLVQEIFGGGPQFYIPSLFADGGLEQFLLFEDDPAGIGIHIPEDMGGGDELAVAESHHAFYQGKGSFEVGRAVINPREEVGMHVGLQGFGEEGLRCGFLFF